MTKLSSNHKLKSNFVLASKIPLPRGQTFSIIPGLTSRFPAWGEVGQNIDTKVHNHMEPLTVVLENFDLFVKILLLAVC